MKPIDPTSLDQARDTLRAHLPLEVVREQLVAVEEELAQRDARIADLERARPVVESDEARRLREAWAKAGEWARSSVCNWNGRDSAAQLGAALRAFCESAPPASAPSDDLRAQLDERTRQVAQLQDDLCDAQNARDKAREEIAALKAAPKVEPAQADGERVTVYVKQNAAGAAFGPFAECERATNTLTSGESWLAIDARRVREGGAS